MRADVCPAWLSFALDNQLRKRIHDPEKLFREYVKPGATAADIGCGPGYFTMGLADLVGDAGRVYAVDIQGAMLERVRKRANQRRLASRIVLHRCREDRMDIPEKLDFALAFWMVHEVPAPDALLSEISAALKPDGVFLMVEPKMHVTEPAFRRTIDLASACGLRLLREIPVSLSRGMLFGRQEEPKS